MPSISAFRIAKEEVVRVFRDWPQLVRIAGLWSLITIGAVVATCIFLALYEGRPIDIGRYLERMTDGDLTRQHDFANSIGTIFGQLATAIGWTRLVLLREQPEGWLRVPYGSARYFGRSLILALLFVLLAVPGLAIGAIAGSVVPGIFGRVAGGTIMGIGALAALYLCIRMWLVLPATAIQDDSMTFRRSLIVTGAAPLAIVIAPILALVPFVLIAIVIDVVLALLLVNLLGGWLTILADLTDVFAIFAAMAASSGATAVLYERLVPNSPALAQEAA